MGQTHVDATRIRYYGAAGRLNMEKLPALGSVRHSSPRRFGRWCPLATRRNRPAPHCDSSRSPRQPGSVTVESGPFTDRLEITDLSLQPGDHPSVTAALSNVADVSAVIVLELRADFYDAQGGYLGFGTAGYADQEYTDNGTIPLTYGTGEPDGSFTIAVPSTTPLPGAASAILTVPQLVNE